MTSTALGLISRFGLVCATVGVLLLGSQATRGQSSSTPPGAGTEADPYLISQLGHLLWVSQYVSTSEGTYYVMTADIDASETATWNDSGTDETVLEGFPPIGRLGGSHLNFRGVFDGNGHTITGLVIDRRVNIDYNPFRYVGLFGYVSSGAQIRNLGVTRCSVAGHIVVGGLVGFLYESSVSNCHATGTVSGESLVGGLVGENVGSITASYATCTVTAHQQSAGGLVGRGSGAIASSYATGPVTGAARIGGLIGDLSGDGVSACFAAGTVSGGASAGGLVGRLRELAAITDCYAVGSLAGAELVGGLIGENETGRGTVSNSYWDMETSGQVASAGGIGQTTAEMKQVATFAGWDFADTWGIAGGVSYPYLQWAPPDFALQLEVLGPGDVTVDPAPAADGTYAPGTLVTLTATWDPANAELQPWMGAVPSGPMTATVLMDAHRTVRVTFRALIEISTLAELALIGKDPAYPLTNVKYTLTADIDASETATWNDPGTDTNTLEGFAPIAPLKDIPFRGEFDGNGHTISGLWINRGDEDRVGLFGTVGEVGIVSNLELLDAEVFGLGESGSAIGRMMGATVLNCQAHGSVRGASRVGGLIGIANGGALLECRTSCEVVGSSGSIGGLVGTASANFRECYATGPVSGGWSVGGLVGGLVGHADSCFAMGPVIGGDSVGGLAGLVYSAGSLTDCYAAGSVAGAAHVGGLVGEFEEQPVTVTNSYWDVETTGQSVSAGGDGKTTAEMKQAATFAGWDFADTWNIVEGVSYPYLQSAPPRIVLDLLVIGPGTVMADPPPGIDGAYAPGTVVTLTAVWDPAAAVFREWSGAAPLDASTATVVMDVHRTVTATFLSRIAIATLEDLAKIGNDPAYPSSGVYYELTADIDASDTANWNDEGTSTITLEGFRPIELSSAVFDGNDHTISGLHIRRSSSAVGLFSLAQAGTDIRNVALLNATIDGGNYVGAIVGLLNSSRVSNCHVGGEVRGWQTGGLVGYSLDGELSGCSSSCVVTGTGHTGGLVGYALDTILAHSAAHGAVRGASNLGGLIGFAGGTGHMSNCYATASVRGTMSNIGGLAGRCGVTVHNCYATGPVRGDSEVGGLIGDIGIDGEVAECFSISPVAGRSSVGGLIGAGDPASTTNSYWDIAATGQTTSTGGEGRSTTELRQQATFNGWDFTNAWNILEGTSYPFLHEEGPPFSFSVTTTAGGTVTAEPLPAADGTYAAGTVVTLTASWDPNSVRLTDWAGAPTTGSATAQVVMDAHKSVHVTFVRKIGNLTDLAKIGHDSACPLENVHYELMADIDASATATWNDPNTDVTVLEGFEPIRSFSGVFDGRGHTISGLVVNRADEDRVGLFGSAETAAIRNVGLAEGVIVGRSYVGGLVGYTTEVFLTDCWSTGSVNGSRHTGGLVGQGDGQTIRCRSSCDVTGEQDVGGLVGSSGREEITNCHATGAVVGDSYVGGLVGGKSDGVVAGSYATGAVVYSPNRYFGGGLVGSVQQCDVLDCFATGPVEGGMYAGGLLGGNSGDVVRSYATGTVTGTEKVGGLVGHQNSSGEVSDCYATGTVSGDIKVGGLVGMLFQTTVIHSFSSGLVTGNSDSGGLVGAHFSGSVSGSYWDTQTSGHSMSAGGEGRTTAEMMQQATFSGWDFVDVWDITESVTYPLLRGLSTDVDGDGVLDGLDLCPGTIPGVVVDAEGCPPMISADVDFDGDVDMGDFNAIAGCLGGPWIAVGAECAAVDGDGDGDADLAELAGLQQCFSGANVPADPACGD